MKTIYLLIMLALSSICCWSQSLTASSLTAMCPGAVLYSAAQQADLANLSPPYNSLLYAPTFPCNIPVTCTLCKVTLGFFENRMPPTIGPKQRLFTVMFNGQVSDSLDLFSLVGSQKPYTRTWTVPVYDGFLHLSLRAQLLNALLSTVTVSDANTGGITGGPCTASVDASTPPMIYAVLPDGTCFPVRPVPPVGYLADAIGVWTAANVNGQIQVQSFFSLIKPIDTTQGTK